MTQTPDRVPSPARRRRRFGHGATAVLVLASVLTIAVRPSAEAANPFDPSFPLRAQIALTDCDPTCATGTKAHSNSPAGMIDIQRRRFYAYVFHGLTHQPEGIGVIDLDRRVQVDWIDLGPSGLNLPPAFTRPVLDTTSNRMFIGKDTYAAGCDTSPTSLEHKNVRGCVVNDLQGLDLQLSSPQFAVLDLARRSVEIVTIPAADTEKPHAVMAGQGVASIAVDAARDRLYVLVDGGRVFEQGFVQAGFDPVGPAVVAYDLASLDADSETLWVYRPRACTAVLTDKSTSVKTVAFGVGYDDAGTQDAPFLYFPCIGTTQGVSPARYPHGIVRVDLHDTPDSDPTAGFATEWFHFAGDALGGFAFGDLVNHRVVLGVGGIGPGRVYVFDVLHRAWVGRMVLSANSFGSGGVDTATGRIYVWGGPDDGRSPGHSLRIIDPAGLPAVVRAAGVAVGDNPPGLPRLMVDPLTRHVMRLGAAGFHVVIHEDRIPPFLPTPGIHPDNGTHDIDESTAVQVTHTAAGSAYGARVQLARGLRGLPFAGPVAGFLDTTPLRIEGGDRGLFLSQIRGAMLTGQADDGDATASAVAARMGESTETDIRGKYEAATGEATDGAGDSECDESAPGLHCLRYESVTGNVGGLAESSCSNFGVDGDPQRDAEEGSAVRCSPLDRVTAWSSASSEQPDQAGPVSFGVAHTESSVEAVKDPDGGVITVSRAVARGVNITVPERGSFSIGEIESTATSRSTGRPNAGPCDAPVSGCTKSIFTSTAKNVRLRDATGKTLFACGVPGLGSTGDPCEMPAIVRLVNQYFAGSVRARGPRQELDPLVVNSPRGARAVVTKEGYAFANDLTLHGDAQREVTGLELIFYNDNYEPSRLIVELAGVYSEAQYQIGVPKPPVNTDPTRLTIALIDDTGDALEGGVFQVRATDPLGLPGELVAACVTGDDGVGDCEFEGLPMGDYVVTETVPPAGYAGADDAQVSLVEGLHTEVTFTNLRAVGGIEISLTDDGAATGTPRPLQGATFVVLADDGDLVRGDADQHYDECTTDELGECRFDDVPLGAYVVYQAAAPDGHLLADDVGFALELPGQVAALSYVTGLEGTPAIPGDGGDEGSDGSVDQPRDVAFVDEPTETTTVIVEAPPFRPIANVSTAPLRPRGLGRIIGLPGEALGFLRREPLEAVLFGLVWLLLAAPLYLAARRRTLTIAKEVV